MGVALSPPSSFSSVPSPLLPPAQCGRSVRPIVRSVEGCPSVPGAGSKKWRARTCLDCSVERAADRWLRCVRQAESGSSASKRIIRRISSQKRSSASSVGRLGKTFCAQAGVGRAATFHCCFISIIDERHAIVARYSAVCRMRSLLGSSWAGSDGSSSPTRLMAAHLSSFRSLAMASI